METNKLHSYDSFQQYILKICHSIATYYRVTIYSIWQRCNKLFEGNISAKCWTGKLWKWQFLRMNCNFKDELNWNQYKSMNSYVSWSKGNQVARLLGPKLLQYSGYIKPQKYCYQEAPIVGAEYLLTFVSSTPLSSVSYSRNITEQKIITIRKIILT